jgi:serine protein kinase
MAEQRTNALSYHITAVKKGERVFENAFQSVSRMILEGEIDKVVVNGKSTFDFHVFRKGPKHIVGMYDEINSFVSFIKDASEGGSSAEMAFVLVGEPGNGKTFLVEYLCKLYRRFLSIPTNRKYTFRFVGLNKLGSYGNITTIESQTYEDPLILAMNLEESRRIDAAPCPALSCRQADAREMGGKLSPLGCLHRLYLEQHPRVHRRQARRYAGVRRDRAGAPGGEPRHGHRQVPGQGQDHLLRRRPAR